ncbi:MAG: ribosome-associated translation inhibitor RaiA [Flavobacteriaceae bacterium]|nr:ribosome-associated translation inhibitor RaiA [Bacteroidia bacterium]NNK82849.1 ribosome-associated translation inhibitor RaiA [Flavobacteriaceae bacterium]
MTINFQYVRMAKSEAMNEFAKERLDKLAKKYDWIINAQVHFKAEHDSKKQNGRVCKMELSVPGPRIFAESYEDTFEKAIKNTIQDLDKQLRKRKKTFQTH